MIPAITQLPATNIAGMLKSVAPIVLKCIEVVRTYFLIISNSCLVGLGFKEIVFEAVRRTDENPLEPAIRFFHHLWDEIKSGDIHFLQGASFVLSGVTGVLAISHRLQYIDLKFFAPVCEALGTGFFFIGNLLALVTNVEQYIRASEMTESGDPAQVERGNVLKYSAVAGIINNLSYLMIPTLMLFGAPFACALVFGCIAIFTGCIKILIDYFF